MKLMSEDFKENDSIPSRFTCDGEDISPQLHWEDTPERTKSFALSMTDPDAPGGTFVHWLVYNITKDVRMIEEGAVPAGAEQAKNDFGKQNYGGPCPPSGTHRYYFRLYAVDIESLKEKIDRASFFEIVKKHAVTSAVLMGRYKRK